jgi:hypothetical protein
MNKLTRSDLMSLEDYAAQREEFRRKVMAHKDRRIAAVGPNVRLFFEDRLTLQYQVQEMLRAERIFEAAGIQEELDAYNPLIPDGQNLKATMMIEFADVEERHRRLGELVGIEDRTFVQVEGHERVYAIADEDMERDTPEKTSAVHFLRFELGPEGSADLAAGAALHIGIDHDHYSHLSSPVPDTLRDALARDIS